MVSISQRSEERGLYNLVYNLAISNPCLKAVSSNASLGGNWNGSFFEGNDRGLLEKGVQAYLMA